MVTIKPIEPAAIDFYNESRFYGDVNGLVASNGLKTCGHSLFRIEGDVTIVLEIKADDDFLFDGIMRASIAKGESYGAHSFVCDEEGALVENWMSIYCKNCDLPIANHIIFNSECS